jgi:acetoacetate decarboxylase
MRIDDVRRPMTTPLTSPAYAPTVPRFTDREYLDMRVQELVRTEITDVVVKGACTGPARLQLLAHVLAPPADLPVVEVASAGHILTDLTPAPVEPGFDNLKGDAQ